MIVILDNLRSALNVGSIVRTCDALGIKDIYFCGITPNPTNKKVLKTSLGAEKNINVYLTKSTTEAIDKLKASNHIIFGLELSPSAVNIDSYKKTPKTVLVVGNEVSGLSEDVIKKCDTLLQIPMKGVKESLNVATAFGIAGYLISRVD